VISGRIRPDVRPAARRRGPTGREGEPLPVYRHSSVLRAGEVFRPAIISTCPSLIICPNHVSGDPTPQPEDRRQLHRWLIGIDEDGIFINPELVARAVWCRSIASAQAIASRSHSSEIISPRLCAHVM
jgi:RadC-like JAB domain